jgi:hypothetical protein
MLALLVALLLSSSNGPPCSGHAAAGVCLAQASTAEVQGKLEVSPAHNDTQELCIAVRDAAAEQDTGGACKPTCWSATAYTVYAMSASNTQPAAMLL